MARAGNAKTAYPTRRDAQLREIAQWAASHDAATFVFGQLKDLSRLEVEHSANIQTRAERQFSRVRRTMILSMIKLLEGALDSRMRG